MIAGVIVFVTAGNWQRGRMLEKETLRAQFDAAANAASMPLPAGSDWRLLRYRPVAATGEYDVPRQMLLDNRVRDGHVGYEVVAPLRLADGRVVLVNRGWVAQGGSRTELPLVPPPTGTLTVQGRINFAPAYLELQMSSPVGPVWQNLDPQRFAAATGIDVLPIIVEETENRGDGLLRDWPAADFGVDKHRIYMLEWYAFAALALVLWIPLNWRKRGVADRR
jgi:surfeit locus 1 family protein